MSEALEKPAVRRWVDRVLAAWNDIQRPLYVAVAGYALGWAGSSTDIIGNAFSVAFATGVQEYHRRSGTPLLFQLDNLILFAAWTQGLLRGQPDSPGKALALGAISWLIFAVIGAFRLRTKAQPAAAEE